MKHEAGELPLQEVNRVFADALSLCVTPPLPDGGLDYVASLQSALKHKYPWVLVTYLQIAGVDWVVFYRSSAPGDLLGAGNREDFVAPAREAHGLPVMGSDLNQKRIPQAKVAGVVASLCSAGESRQLSHEVRIGKESVKGTPRHKTREEEAREKQKNRVGILLTISASGNEIEVFLGSGTKSAIVVGTADEIRQIRSYVFAQGNDSNLQLELYMVDGRLTTGAASLLKALKPRIECIQKKAATDFQLSPPASPKG